jgi:hypothetical protein
MNQEQKSMNSEGVADSGIFGNALSFISSEANQQSEVLNAEGNSMFESIKSFSPFGSSEKEVPVAQAQGAQTQGSQAQGAQTQGAQSQGSQAPVTVPQGGRRSSKSRSMRMKGGLNPAFGYYAAPVTDSVTAQPTYMMKYTGGKRRKSCRRRTCKRRKSCRRKRSCKRRRSKRH